MSQTSLEDRVARLEQRLDELVREKAPGGEPRLKDWRRTVGMFKGDPIMQEVIAEALGRREEERRQAREQEGGEE